MSTRFGARPFRLPYAVPPHVRCCNYDSGSRFMELVVALLAGLTTGGLTCLAVQGELLASLSPRNGRVR